MADSSAPAPAGSSDTSVSDLRSLAADMPMDAFGFDDEGGDDAAQPAAEGQESATHEEGRPRDAGGRFTPRDGQTEQGGESAAQDASDEDGAAQAQSSGGEGEEPQGEKEPGPEEEGKRLDFLEIEGRRYTPEDIHRGFLRNEDYSRKTGEIARERQALHAQTEQIKAYEQQLAGVLDLNIGWLRESLPPQPDPAMLDSDPVGYHKQALAHSAAVQKFQAAAAHREQMQHQTAAQRQQAEQQQSVATQQALQSEFARMQEKIPELRTPEGRDTFFREARTLGAHYGLSEQDIMGIQDHRALHVLKDAMAYRKLQAAKPQTTQTLKAAPPIRQQARPAAGTRDGQAKREATQRFAANPSIHTALAAGVLDDVFADLP